MELVGQVEVEGTVGLRGETQIPTIYPGGMGGMGAHCCSHLGPWDPGGLPLPLLSGGWCLQPPQPPQSRGPGSKETEGAGDMQSEGPNCLFLSQECLLLSPEGDLCGHGVGEG